MVCIVDSCNRAFSPRKYYWCTQNTKKWCSIKLFNYRNIGLLCIAKAKVTLISKRDCWKINIEREIKRRSKELVPNQSKKIKSNNFRGEK